MVAVPPVASPAPVDVGGDRAGLEVQKARGNPRDGLPAPVRGRSSCVAGHQGQLGGGRGSEARGAHLHGWVQAGGGSRGGIRRCGHLKESAGDRLSSAVAVGHDLPGGGGCCLAGCLGVVPGSSAGGGGNHRIALALCAGQCAEPA
ncbi:unnamed protein product [Heterosigma akashiwo]